MYDHLGEVSFSAYEQTMRVVGSAYLVIYVRVGVFRGIFSFIPRFDDSFCVLRYGEVQPMDASQVKYPEAASSLSLCSLTRSPWNPSLVFIDHPVEVIGVRTEVPRVALF